MSDFSVSEFAEVTDVDVQRAAKAWGVSKDEAAAFIHESAQQAEYAAEYMKQGVDQITAFVMANDRQSAEHRYQQVVKGEVSAEYAINLTGSYAALDLAVRLYEEGHLDEATLLREWPEWWRGTDPDDTDPRYLRIWRKAWEANGRTYVRDGRALPRTKVLTVMRGQRPGDPVGMAWTLDPKIAAKFAVTLGGRHRVSGGGVIRAEVERSKVLGYLTKRGESEVVVDPRSLKGVRT